MSSRWLLAAVVLTTALVGCKADPHKPSGFFGSTKGMKEAKEVKAYHKVWYKPDANYDKFKSIYIAPVNTTYLRKNEGWDKIALAGADARKLADYMRKVFIQAYTKAEDKTKLKVVGKIGPDTLVFEMALIEIVPTKAWLNAVGIAGIGMALDKGGVAMEARVRDGRTWEVLIVVADREMGKENLLNVKDLGWSLHAKAIIDEWADQAVEATCAEEGKVVEDSSGFEWKLW